MVSKSAKNCKWNLHNLYRPITAWITISAIVYEVLIAPIVNGILMLLGIPAAFKGNDISLLITLITTTGVFGLARTVEKFQGTNSDRE